jgi:hypothetical protein
VLQGGSGGMVVWYEKQITYLLAVQEQVIHLLLVHLKVILEEIMLHQAGQQLTMLVVEEVEQELQEEMLVLVLEELEGVVLIQVFQEVQ